MEWIGHRDERYSPGNIVSGIVIALYGDRWYFDEQRLTYKEAESLCCTPETNVTLWVNYTSIIIVIKINLWIEIELCFMYCIWNEYKISKKRWQVDNGIWKSKAEDRAEKI